LQRLDALQTDLRTLPGIAVIACPLVWNDGYAQEGLSALGRYLDHPPPARHGRVRVMPMWFQSAGDTRGQGWVGAFTDADGNGVMEFRPAGAGLPADLWTPELNFLRLAP